MAVALLWIASPTTDFYNGFGVGEPLAPRSGFGRRSRRICTKQKQKWNSSSLNVEKLGRRAGFCMVSSMLANPAGEVAVLSSEQKVYGVVLKQAALVNRQLRSRDDLDLDVKADIVVPGTLG